MPKKYPNPAVLDFSQSTAIKEAEKLKTKAEALKTEARVMPLRF
jgi:hypothetical protein